MSDITTCMECGVPRGKDALGWIDEVRPTLGGGSIRYICCFRCRRLVVPFEGSDKCSGRCGGKCDSATAYSATCLTCLDDEGAGPEQATRLEWSCWDVACVQAWAKTHPYCEVDVDRSSSVEWIEAAA